MKADRKHSRQPIEITDLDMNRLVVRTPTWGWPHYSVFNRQGACLFTGKVKPAALPALTGLLLATSTNRNRT